MKKHLQTLTICLGVLASATCIAQPTFTSTDINPVINDQFTINAAAYVDPGSGGANQTWDFSSMTPTSTANYTTVSAASTGYGSTFPGANIALSSGGAYAFYNTTSSVWQIYGYYNGGTSIPYNNPEDLLRYPFTYLNTYTDTWHATFVSAGYTYSRNGTTSVTADGYGTLKTPAGTFSNALRVHFVQNYTDSTFIGAWQVLTYQNDEYIWYIKNYHYGFLSTYTLTTFAGTSQQATYASNLVGINEASDLMSSFDVSPNPANDYVYLNINLLSKQQVEVRIYNVLGSLVKTISSFDGLQGDNRYRIDLADLREGDYFLRIVLDGKVTAAKQFLITK